MTSQGSAHGRFTRATQQRNLWAAESSLRELGSVSLEDALGYLALLERSFLLRLRPPARSSSAGHRLAAVRTTVQGDRRRRAHGHRDLLARELGQTVGGPR